VLSRTDSKRRYDDWPPEITKIHTEANRNSLCESKTIPSAAASGYRRQLCIDLVCERDGFCASSAASTARQGKDHQTEVRHKNGNAVSATARSAFQMVLNLAELTACAASVWISPPLLPIHR